MYLEKNGTSPDNGEPAFLQDPDRTNVPLGDICVKRPILHKIEKRSEGLSGDSFSPIIPREPISYRTHFALTKAFFLSLPANVLHGVDVKQHSPFIGKIEGIVGAWIH
jgi:hypothetical protein